VTPSVALTPLVALLTGRDACAKKARADGTRLKMINSPSI